MSDLRAAAQAVVDAFADPNARANLRGQWLHLSGCLLALREALEDQPHPVPEIDYDALIAACYERTKAAQGTRGCVQFSKGAEWFREQCLAPTPRAAVRELNGAEAERAWAAATRPGGL